MQGALPGFYPKVKQNAVDFRAESMHVYSIHRVGALDVTQEMENWLNGLHWAALHYFISCATFYVPTRYYLIILMNLPLTFY